MDVEMMGKKATTYAMSVQDFENQYQSSGNTSVLVIFNHPDGNLRTLTMKMNYHKEDGQFTNASQGLPHIIEKEYTQTLYNFYM